MRVFRIEHEDDRLGPWAHDRNFGIELLMNNMPTWWMDSHVSGPFKSPTNEHSFAFVSLEDFNSWVPNFDRELLEQAGFVLSEYEVPEYAVSIARHQAIFIREKAQLIKATKLTRVSL
jgi:hypothetical protein